MYYQQKFQDEKATTDAYTSTYCYQSAADSNYPLHCHAYYELSFVIEGKRYEYYNGKPYIAEKNSLFFLEPLVIHGNQNITSIHDMVIQLSPNFLWASSLFRKTDLSLTLAHTEQPSLKVPEDSALMEILCEIRRLCTNTPVVPVLQKQDIAAIGKELSPAIQQEWKQSALILQLLIMMTDIGFLTFQERTADHQQISSLGTLINRILDAPAEIPNMTEASAFVGMSYYNFSRFFKKTTGFHYNEYCNSLRLQYAEHQLINSDQTVAEIAHEIGIDTASYFTRLFKKYYGISPMQFRQEHKYRKNIT